MLSKLNSCTFAPSSSWLTFFFPSLPSLEVYGRHRAVLEPTGRRDEDQSAELHRQIARLCTRSLWHQQPDHSDEHHQDHQGPGALTGSPLRHRRSHARERPFPLHRGETLTRHCQTAAAILLLKHGTFSCDIIELIQKKVYPAEVKSCKNTNRMLSSNSQTILLGWCKCDGLYSRAAHQSTICVWRYA